MILVANPCDNACHCTGARVPFTKAMEEAAADLVRLERYHRRTWSQQKRAIRAFTNMKLMRASDNDANQRSEPPNKADQAQNPATD